MTGEGALSTQRLAFASIEAIAEGIRTRALSCVDVVANAIDRCNALHETLNCFVTYMPEAALTRAAALDALLESGLHLGPLHGVPIVHKDNIFTAGVRTTGGSKVFADFVPDKSAPVVGALENAGAVVLAKTNLFELGAGGVSPIAGNVRNPWDESRASGVSSSGTASAIAAGLAYGGTGTDTGGSVRLPAAACGVVGLKPTYELVSRVGVFPVSYTLDHVGVVARDVFGSAALLEHAATTGPAARSRRPQDYTSTVKNGIAGERIGLPKRQVDELLSQDLAGALEGAADLFRAAGASVVDVELPSFAEGRTVVMAIYPAECAEHYRAEIESSFRDFSDGVQATLLMGQFISANDYVRSQRLRARLTAEMRAVFRTVDAVIAPTMPTAAWPLESTSLLIDGVEEELIRGVIRYSAIFNATGQPAISIPCGFSRDGLPLGMQVAGRPFEEERILRVARAYEQSAGWLSRIPDLTQASSVHTEPTQRSARSYRVDGGHAP